jgi:hypothetical protein
MNFLQPLQFYDNFIPDSSARRRETSSFFPAEWLPVKVWIPAFAGMTRLKIARRPRVALYPPNVSSKKQRHPFRLALQTISPSTSFLSRTAVSASRNPEMFSPAVSLQQQAPLILIGRWFPLKKTQSVIERKNIFRARLGRFNPYLQL